MISIRNNAGYTLIEILVALTVMGLIFAVGYVNFRDFSRRQAIAGAGKIMQGDMRLAQQLALSGQKPDDSNCSDPNYLGGYYFSIVSGSEYEVIAYCSGGSVANSSKDITLPSGIAISPIPSPNPILFKVLGTGTNIPEGSTETITLVQDQTTNTYTISVGSGGDIR